MTAGYIPALTRRPPNGTTFVPYIIALFSSTGQPNFACQLYEWRKSRRAFPAPSALHSYPNWSYPSDMKCWTSTPSFKPVTGVALSINHPAARSELASWIAALLVSASYCSYSNTTCVPANGLSGSVLDLSFVRSVPCPIVHVGKILGALQTARLISDFSNSARFASTASSFDLADTRSVFSASAFLSTLPALSWAAFAVSFASFAEALAPSASNLASLADSCAVAASFESSEESASLPLRIHVSTVPILDSSHNSPDTPAATRPAPSSPITKSSVGGLSGACIKPRLKSCSSSRYSQTTKTTSSATPTATKVVQNPNHQYNEELRSLRLASALLSADSSVMALHEGQEYLAKLQLIAIIIIFSLGILTLIGIDLWDKYISNAASI